MTESTPEKMLNLLKEAVANADRIGCIGAWRLEALLVIAEAEGRSSRQ